jgi:hypothetical protein
VEVPDPPVFAVESAQYLRHGQRQQLSIGELRAAAPARAGLHNMVVDEHIEFGQEGFLGFWSRIDLGNPPPRNPATTHLQGINHLGTGGGDEAAWMPRISMAVRPSSIGSEDGGRRGRPDHFVRTMPGPRLSSAVP